MMAAHPAAGEPGGGGVAGAGGTGWPALVPAAPPAPPQPGPPASQAWPSRQGARARPAGDRSGRWLRAAGAGLAMLATAAATVSFTAQYRMVYAARRMAAAAGLEAAIPDAAALVFACLGIALALHGRRALRARFCNLAAVGASVFMNTAAAAPGWRAAAIWVMPPAAYALASDTLIGVIRARAIARHQARGSALAGEEPTPLAAAGGLALWLLRLVLAPVSTLAGFRAWVLAECPAAPGRRAPRDPAGLPRPRPDPRQQPRQPALPGTRPGTKTARFLALAEREHGPLASIPPGQVGRISAALAPRAGLHPGAARAALRRAVLAAREGETR